MANDRKTKALDSTSAQDATNAPDATESSLERWPNVVLELFPIGTANSNLQGFDRQNDVANRMFGEMELIDSSTDQEPSRELQRSAQRRPEPSSIQVGENNLIVEATDAKGRTRSFEYNDARELVKVTMENDETWSRTRKDGDVWIWESDRGNPARRLLNQKVLNDGTLFVETSAQNRIYFHQDGKKEIVDYKEMLAATHAIRAAMRGWGTDEQAIFQGLEGKTPAQTECIQSIYKKEFRATVSGDFHKELSGSDYKRADELLEGNFDRVSEIDVALEELSGYTGRSSDTLEALIRNTIRTMSSTDLDKADERSLEHGEWTFRESMWLNPNVSAETKLTNEILLKGFDKLTLDDHHKMAKIALEAGNSDLFQEAMRFSPKEVRDYYGVGDGKAKVKEAFGAKWYQTATALALTGAVPIVGIAIGSQLRQREQHADDYAKHGKLKLSTQIYENSSLLGDNEAAIENLFANLSDDERQQYRIGRWLNEDTGVVVTLSANDDEALSKYSKEDKENAKSLYSETSKALKHVAGLWFNDSAMESEFMKWEASITTPGGGLIAQVASHNKLLDSDIDDVLRDIENMSESEWSRLQSEQGYRERVESALGTFLNESELSKALDILDAKQFSDSYKESKQARRGILDMVKDNVGLTVDETEIYDALQDVRHEDAVALQQHGGNNELAHSLRVLLATNLSSDEQHAAAGLLSGIFETGETQRTIIDTLNIHAADKNTNERLVVKDIEKAFRDDPDLRKKILDFDSKFSKEFVAAAKHAVGSKDYETYVKPLIETGELSLDVRMTLNTWFLNFDENNSFEDVASYGKSLDGLSLEQRLEMASKKKFQDTNFSYFNDEERKIATNTFAQGEFRPEDKIRAAVIGGGTDEDAIKSVLSEVRRSDKYNGLSQSEFDSRVKANLAKMKVDYARKYGEDLPTRLVDELSQRDFHQAELNLNVRTSEAEFLLAQRRASETRDGFGSSLNDAIWDGTGFQVDEDMRDLVQAMQLQPDQVSRFALELHTAASLHATSKEAMANAIVDATLAAAAVGASVFTGGVSLSLLSATAFAGALFKVGAKSLVMGGDYDFASMGISDAAGGAFEAATIFLGTNLLKVGGGAGISAAKDALAMGGDDLLREGSEAIIKAFESDVERLLVNSLKQRAQGVTSQAIAEIAAKYARPQQAEALAAILTDSIGKSVQEVGEQWLKTTAVRAANNTVDGAIGGGGAGTLAAIGSADNLEQVAQRGLVSAGIGSISAGTASIGFSIGDRAFGKSGRAVEEGLPESAESSSPSHASTAEIETRLLSLPVELRGPVSELLGRGAGWNEIRVPLARAEVQHLISQLPEELRQPMTSVLARKNGITEAQRILSLPPEIIQEHIRPALLNPEGNLTIAITTAEGRHIENLDNALWGSTARPSPEQILTDPTQMERYTRINQQQQPLYEKPGQLNLPEAERQRWVEAYERDEGLAGQSLPSNGAPVQQGRLLHLVLGPPGAGKTRGIVNNLRDQFGARVIDSDFVKPGLPGYHGGLGTQIVHGASDSVAVEVRNRAIANGDNIVQPVVGRTIDGIHEILRQARENGYEVAIYLADIPPALSVKRVYERGYSVDPHEGGIQQVIPLDYVLNKVGFRPRIVFDHLVSTPGLVDSWTRYDTSDFPPTLTGQSVYQLSSRGS